jgi:hypothetical protein
MLPLRCRGSKYSPENDKERIVVLHYRTYHIITRASEHFMFAEWQTLHIAKQCFTQDLSCASRWFASQTNTSSGVFAAPLSRHSLW